MRSNLPTCQRKQIHLLKDLLRWNVYGIWQGNNLAAGTTPGINAGILTWNKTSPILNVRSLLCNKS
jgi:hypothetical protein